jgi:hypothetical protein
MPAYISVFSPYDFVYLIASKAGINGIPYKKLAIVAFLVGIISMKLKTEIRAAPLPFPLRTVEKWINHGFLAQQLGL